MHRISKFILNEPTLFVSWMVLLAGSLGTLAEWAYFRNFAIDFGVFWRTAHEPISIVYTQHSIYPFPYPPSAKLFISPLVLLPAWPAFFAWSFLSAFLLWISVKRSIGLWPSVLMMLCPPVTNGLATGQISIALAALILLGLRTERRLLAGCAFGAVAAIKPQLVLFLPMLLFIRRDWAALATAGATFASVLIVTTYIYGLPSWHAWIAALPEFRDAIYRLKIERFVITFPGLADRLGLSVVMFASIGAIIGTTVVIRSTKQDYIVDAAVVAVASFFVAPYALTYDLVLLAPYLVREIYRRNILPTLVLAGIPNPLPLFLAAATIFGASLNLGDLTARFRKSEM